MKAIAYAAKSTEDTHDSIPTSKPVGPVPFGYKPEPAIGPDARR